MTIIDVVLAFFGNRLMKWGFERFGSWIATRALPFHSWLRKCALKRRHDSLADMSIKDRTWSNFHNSIRTRLDDNDGLQSVLALCGKKQCAPVERRRYYDLFYEWSAGCANFLRVCRIFVEKNEDGFDATTRKDITTHRDTPGVFAFELRHENLGGVEARFPKLREELEKGFGLVIFCYKNGKRVVVTHEGSNQTDFAVLEDPPNCRAVLDIFLHLCELADERDPNTTLQIRSEVKTLCLGLRQ